MILSGVGTTENERERVEMMGYWARGPHIQPNVVSFWSANEWALKDWQMATDLLCFLL